MNSFKDYSKDFFSSLKSHYPKVLFWTILLYIIFFLYYQVFLEYIFWTLFSNISSYFLYNVLMVIFSYPIILLISLFLTKLNYVFSSLKFKKDFFVKSLKLSLVIFIIFILFTIIEEIYFSGNLLLVILSYILFAFVFGVLFYYQKNISKKNLLNNLYDSIKCYINQKSLFAFLIFVIILIILYVIYYLALSFIFFDFVSVFIFAFVIFCFVKLSTY